MLSILELEDRTKKANEILKEYEEFGYIDLMQEDSEYLYNYIKDLQNKVIEQQKRLQDIDKRSCDRLKALNEIKKVVKSGYYEMHLNPERFSMKILDILKKEGI